jgi:hypothetical protein
MITARRDPRLGARIAASWPLAGVRAGSGLVWRGSRLLTVQDDVPVAALVDPLTRAVERIVLEGTGAPLAKATKPDLEAAALRDDGGVYLFGSGSTPARMRIARIGSDDTVSFQDGRAIYAAIEGWLGDTPNVEGAVISGEILRMFHRGCGPSATSASVDFSIGVLDGEAPVIEAPIRYDLGRAGGVPLGFTDATPQGGARMLYLAVAEDTPNAVADGPVVGAAVGILEGQEARWAPLVEADGAPSLRKAEGIAMDPDGRCGWLVTDPDDPSRPAELCRLELSGPW